MSLNDEEIVATITEYIADKRQKQAILIDGAWGSGKTFFVKETLIPNISKKLTHLRLSTEVLYVSLYGLDTTEKVMNEIYASLTASMFSTKKERSSSDAAKPSVVNIGKLGFKILSGVASTALSAIPIDLPEITAEDWSCIDHLTIIFDDLERCAIPINETLGFINNFVEHNEVNAIIVGNEKEIREENELAHQENRPSVEGTETEVAVKIEPCGKSIAYHNVKEKLIGLTIKYEPDFDSIFDTLINSQPKKTTATKLLTDNKKKVIELFQTKGSNNIRTLQFTLIMLVKVFNCLSSIVLETGENQFYAEKLDLYIFLYIVEACIMIKTTGHLNDNVDSHLNKEKLDLSSISNNTLSSSDSLVFDTLLESQYLDKAEITSLYTSSIKRMAKRDSHKLSYCNIFLWRESEEEDVLSYLEKMEAELKNGHYDPYEIKNLLVLTLQLELIINYDFTALKIQLIDSLKISLETTDPHLIRKLRLDAPDDDNILDQYRSLMVPIFSYLHTKLPSHLDNMNTIVKSKSDRWGEELEALYYDSENCCFREYGFLSSLDTENLKDLLTESTNKNISRFTLVVSLVYNRGDDLSIDYNALSVLTIHVANLISRCDQNIKKHNYQELVNQLDIAIEKNKPKETTS